MKLTIFFVVVVFLVSCVLSAPSEQASNVQENSLVEQGNLIRKTRRALPGDEGEKKEDDKDEEKDSKKESRRDAARRVAARRAAARRADAEAADKDAKKDDKPEEDNKNGADDAKDKAAEPASRRGAKTEFTKRRGGI